MEEILKKSKIFQGLNDEEINSILGCMQAKERSYDKGEFISNAGDILSDIGVVLEGMVHIMKSDYWGNKAIMAEIGAGEIFGEAYACAGVPSGVSVMVVKKARILRLNVSRMLTVCTSACPCHARMITNLLGAMALKNVRLTAKIEHMSQRTTRNKLLSYLSAQSAVSGKSSFTIPFNRQELADFLSVDRSAMSAELSKLKNEGILDYNKNYFILYKG